MPVRRKRRPGSDRLYVTSDDGLPLGHVDLASGEAHDVPAAWRERFTQEANAWLWQNNLPPLPGPAGEAPAIEAGVDPPEGGWEPGWDDLALHLPGHGLSDEAARARASGVPDADRPSRLRADGQHAVDDALAKLTRPALGRVRGARWRIVHAVDMLLDDETVTLDHVVVGPPGVFVLEVLNVPGGRVAMGKESLEASGEAVDLTYRRDVGDEVARRLSEGLARAAGAAETLNPPVVTPVVAVVGATLVGMERPRGVLVSRVGHLPRILQAFGTTLVDQAVAQVYTVARRSDTWTRPEP